MGEMWNAMKGRSRMKVTRRKLGRFDWGLIVVVVSANLPLAVMAGFERGIFSMLYVLTITAAFVALMLFALSLRRGRR